MRLTDSVKESFFKYPSLFYNKDYDRIKHSVCHHMFIVLGNEYDWAETKDTKKAGYLIEPKSRKVNGDWVRIIDKPYGKKTIDLDIDMYLKADKMYQLQIVDHQRTNEHIQNNINMFKEMGKEIDSNLIEILSKRILSKSYREGSRP